MIAPVRVQPPWPGRCGGLRTVRRPAGAVGVGGGPPFVVGRRPLHHIPREPRPAAPRRGDRVPDAETPTDGADPPACRSAADRGRSCRAVPVRVHGTCSSSCSRPRASPSSRSLFRSFFALDPTRRGDPRRGRPWAAAEDPAALCPANFRRTRCDHGISCSAFSGAAVDACRWPRSTVDLVRVRRLLITALSVRCLGERVGPAALGGRDWGFFPGPLRAFLLILRPGVDAFSLGGSVALASTPVLCLRLDPLVRQIELGTRFETAATCSRFSIFDLRPLRAPGLPWFLRAPPAE